MNAQRRFAAVLAQRFAVCANVLGQNILSPQFRVTLRTVAMVGMLVFVACQCVYTMCSAETDLAVNAIADLCVDIKVYIGYCLVE